jgi:hypothetical protein
LDQTEINYWSKSTTNEAAPITTASRTTLRLKVVTPAQQAAAILSSGQQITPTSSVDAPSFDPSGAPGGIGGCGCRWSKISTYGVV